MCARQREQPVGKCRAEWIHTVHLQDCTGSGGQDRRVGQCPGTGMGLLVEWGEGQDQKFCWLYYV